MPRVCDYPSSPAHRHESTERRVLPSSGMKNEPYAPILSARAQLLTGGFWIEDTENVAFNVVYANQRFVARDARD